MNSAQRRKFNRTQNHTITLKCEQYDRYVNFDNATVAARKWCKKNCKGAYNHSHDWNESVFTFQLQRDAVYFALKWL